MWGLIFASFGIAGIILLIRYRNVSSSKYLAILVFGDLSRSPRILNHAFSAANSDINVELLGYFPDKFADIPERIRSHEKIRLRRIPTPEKIVATSNFQYLVLGIKRVVVQFGITLYTLLFLIHTVNFLLVQNPPSIPTLVIAQIVRIIKGSKLIIDWHNFGFTIMGLSRGNETIVVKCAELYEKSFGKYSDAHLVVSNAMADFLRQRFEISGQIIVLHDRAPPHFQPLSIEEKHTFYSTFEPLQKLATKQNVLTLRDDHGLVSYAVNRPAFIVSSTSWTPDEDFSILLDALEQYDTRTSKNIRPRTPDDDDWERVRISDEEGESPERNYAKLLVYISGRGPLKEDFERRLQKRKWNNVNIQTVWLSPEDYPKFLAAADFGISLHTSSSGLDLPMKIVDMFGCGVPVATLEYPT
ncbi:mannosyltransferase [Nowakowskiella sp. JEL0407]|nr:mannosyltransferase [Nowakowskiella sp. JEL0407]